MNVLWGMTAILPCMLRRSSRWLVARVILAVACAPLDTRALSEGESVPAQVD